MIYMKLLNIIKSLSVVEILALIICIFYLAFPLSGMDEVKPMIDSPIGITLIFLTAVGLFLYTNPILAVLYVFVAYELLRRNSINSKKKVSFGVKDVIEENYTSVDNIITTPPITAGNPIDTTSNNRDNELTLMNVNAYTTIEETIVNSMSPIGVSEQSTYVESRVKPIIRETRGSFIQ